MLSLQALFNVLVLGDASRLSVVEEGEASSSSPKKNTLCKVHLSAHTNF
jgi:hypothetical protein